MARTKVYLVPGFFGFTSFGALSYFHRVSETLEEALADRGLEADVIECPTQPSGSITRRADRLRKHVLGTRGDESESIHFIGHSTGGLDVRLLLSPGVRVVRDGSQEGLARKTRSAITMSTPHHGTPLATFFASVQGRHLLEVAASHATSLHGRATIVAWARALSALARLDDFIPSRRNTPLDQLSNALLRRVTMSKRDAVWLFLHEVSADQGIIVQITPESLNLFNAMVVDRPTVAYSSIATAAPRPPFAYQGTEALGVLRTPMAAIFVTLHTLTARMHKQYPYPVPEGEQAAVLADRLPFPVDDRTNDGIVPTLSQIEGRLLHAVAADHLDVVGQFRREGEPLSDWLPSGAHFGEEEFQALWGLVADEIVRAQHERAESGDDASKHRAGAAPSHGPRPASPFDAPRPAAAARRGHDDEPRN